MVLVLGAIDKIGKRVFFEGGTIDRQEKRWVLSYVEIEATDGRKITFLNLNIFLA